jgi:hypothetical protein
MKTYTSILLLSCLWLVNCTSKESTSSPKNTESKKVQIPFSKLEGKSIWEEKNKLIKSIDGEVPKVLFVGFKVEPASLISNVLIRKETDTLLLSGVIHAFADLNKDGVPEFLLEHITKTEEKIYGHTFLLNAATNNLQILKTTKVNRYKKDCANFLGLIEDYEVDNESNGGPYLIVKTTYGIEGAMGCEDYQKVSSTSTYKLEEGSTTLTPIENDDCPVENNKIKLSKLFSYNSNNLSSPNALKFEYRYPNAFFDRFKPCGKDPFEVIGSLEGLRDIDPKGGNAAKRKDLMPYIEMEFMNINPKAIIWGRNNLIPGPNEKQANGYLYSYIYNKVYKERLRVLALVRLMIEQENIEALLSEYAQAKATKYYDENTQKVITKVNTNELLFDKYMWLSKELKKLGFDDGDLWLEDYGFFIRRMLDGSEPEIWETLKYILKMYDGDWFKQTTLEEAFEIDSVSFKQAFKKADGLVLKKKEAIPSDIKIDTSNGVLITARNGNTLTYKNNDSDGESQATYTIAGYWPEREMIVVDYSGWEWGGTTMVNINTGKEENYSWGIQIAKGGQRIAEWEEDAEYVSLSLSKYEDSNRISYYSIANEPMVTNIGNGFWVGNEFFFAKTTYATNKSKFYKVGKLGFEDIKPYTPPLPQTPIKTDFIPADSTLVE